MMSQAMESVTRAFYARSDLDLILSSPVASRRVFAVRIATMAASTVLMAVLLAAPFINILVWRGGARWLSAYGVVIAVGALGGGAVGRADGRAVPHHRAEADAARRADRRRHRRRDLRDRTAGRRDPVLRHAVVFHVPEVGPAGVARAGDRERRVVAGARGAGRPDRARRGAERAASLLLGRAIALFSARFGDHAIAAAGVSDAGVMQRRWRNGFRRVSPRARAAAEGMDAAAPRSLARLADADAAALSAAAGPDAVARLRQPQRRPRAARAGAGDGGGPARRRPRLARDLRRGRARSRRHRADPGAAGSSAPRSKRSPAASRWCSRRSSSRWRLPRRTMR